jgi:mono/diheme cytochrome c family protein
VLLGVAVGAGVAFGALAAAGEDHSFMPKGGRALLLDWLGAKPDTEELRRIVQARRTEGEWRDFVGTRKHALSERQVATLAAYLVVNLPLPDGAQRAPDPAALLPRDGRDLAWEQCQPCHSLFTSHLTQDRDVQAWRNMFQSPFHRELKMTPREREEFARYSALNMPMKIEDVPRDLRF